MELQVEKDGQEYAEIEKRSGAPDPPLYDHAAFVRHVQTLTTKNTRRDVGQVDGNRRGLLIPPKVATTRRVGEVNNAMYIRRINAMIVPFVSERCEMWLIRKALLDCGASENFIGIDTWKTLKIRRLKLEKPIPVHNVDGTILTGLGIVGVTVTG